MTTRVFFNRTSEIDHKMNRMMVYSIVEKRFRRYSALTPDESAQARLYAETG